MGGRGGGKSRTLGLELVDEGLGLRVEGGAGFGFWGCSGSKFQKKRGLCVLVKAG